MLNETKELLRNFYELDEETFNLSNDVMEDIKLYTCCFFGHRKITETDKLKSNLYSEIEKLITNEKVHTFLFGSKSQFDDLCHTIVTELKEKYPHIKRVYVRAEFPYIDDSYREYLLESFEDTYYPEKMIDAGKAGTFDKKLCDCLRSVALELAE